MLPAGCLARGLVVGDAVDRTVLLVGYQQRTVLHLMDVGRTAAERVVLLIEEAGDERLQLGLAARGARHDHVVAELLLAVPGAAPRDERDVLIALGEHVAGVEADAETGR